MMNTLGQAARMNNGETKINTFRRQRTACQRLFDGNTEQFSRDARVFLCSFISSTKTITLLCSSSFHRVNDKNTQRHTHPPTHPPTLQDLRSHIGVSRDDHIPTPFHVKSKNPMPKKHLTILMHRLSIQCTTHTQRERNGTSDHTARDACTLSFCSKNLLL